MRIWLPCVLTGEWPRAKWNQIPMSPEHFNVLVEHMHEVGERLIGAFAEQARLSALSCKNPDDLELFNQWARARQAVKELRKDYNDAVSCCHGGSTWGDCSEDSNQTTHPKHPKKNSCKFN
jgi:hypothetical protein